MNRRWLIALSLLAHAGLGVGLFVAGVWRIEKIDFRYKGSLVGVMIPPGAIPEGGSSAAAAPEPERKKKKRVVKDTQPAPRAVEAPELASATAKDGDGEGAVKGSGTGDGDGPPGGVSCDDPLGCTDGTTGGGGPPANPICGNAIVEAGETCDDGNVAAGDGCSAVCKAEIKTINVPPMVLQGMRISGETQVHAPDTVKTMMLRDGKDRTVGALKLCIAVDGGISSVAIASSTKYAAYDAKLVAAARGWRYRPYTVNGRPMPVCGVVTFVYTIR